MHHQPSDGRAGELDHIAQQLSLEKSLKCNTISGYQKSITLMRCYTGFFPAIQHRPLQMRRYLAQLYYLTKTTADSTINAVDWWHEVHNIPSPCNESIVRLRDAMHRDLPKQGNKPRRALITKEGVLLLTLSDARITSSGDHWPRNSTILALDLCTLRPSCQRRSITTSLQPDMVF